MTLRETAFHWLRGETARAQNAAYIRDSIHVSLLAKAYAAFVGATRRQARCTASTRAQPALPTWFRFAKRVSRAPVRINTDHVNPERLQTRQDGTQPVEYYAENSPAPSGALLDARG